MVGPIEEGHFNAASAWHGRRVGRGRAKIRDARGSCLTSVVAGTNARTLPFVNHLQGLALPVMPGPAGTLVCKTKFPAWPLSRRLPSSRPAGKIQLRLGFAPIPVRWHSGTVSEPVGFCGARPPRLGLGLTSCRALFFAACGPFHQNCIPAREESETGFRPPLHLHLPV